MRPKLKNCNPLIISTLGPACSTESSISDLQAAGVDIFRINLSHAPLTDIEHYFNIAERLGINIGIDTEGAQIRTKLALDDYVFTKGDIYYFDLTGALNSNSPLSLYPSEIYDLLEPDLLIRLDFNGVIIRITTVSKDHIEYKVVSGGLVGNNKGADLLSSSIRLPDLTTKDIQALQICCKLGIKNIFLSFCQSTQAVHHAKQYVDDSIIFSKIECKKGIHNLHQICKVSDAILIDRGDLSRQISLLDIPFAQRGIINLANKLSTPCYVATNVLESLITGDLPTRAELNDIISTLEMGASGIVLAAETAIGKHPRLSVEIVRELMSKFLLFNNNLLFADLDRNEISDEHMKIWLNRVSRL